MTSAQTILSYETQNAATKGQVVPRGEADSLPAESSHTIGSNVRSEQPKFIVEGHVVPRGDALSVPAESRHAGCFGGPAGSLRPAPPLQPIENAAHGADSRD
jgi:hypothetical protein